MAEGGEVLEVIDTGAACQACMLGGEDGRTLFMLATPKWLPRRRDGADGQNSCRRRRRAARGIAVSTRKHLLLLIAVISLGVAGCSGSTAPFSDAPIAHSSCWCRQATSRWAHPDPNRSADLSRSIA